MKTLRTSSLIFIAFFLFSCSKEHSVEKIVTPAGSWQFNDAAKVYAGNIDTAYIETSGTTQILNLLGTSADGQQDFALLLYSTGTFTAGTYKASLFQSEFQYSSQSRTLYDADQFIGEFIVTISAIGNNTITGIFSGDAEDSTGAIKPITLGKFTSRIDLSSTGTGGGGNAAIGTLGASAGVCTPVTPGGTFTQGVALTSSNTATIQVTVTTPGTYTITTNTINGVSFSKSGTFATTGLQSVVLVGSGTPVASGNQTFTVTFGTGMCTFVINFLAGAGPSTGTLGGSPGTCTAVTPAGTFTQGVALTSSNTATIQVNVATAGTYTISTNTVNGVSFSKSGTFTTTGVQSVVLVGSGTPVASGNQTFTVTFGSSNCTFAVNFLAGAAPATGTLGGNPGACTPVTLAGTYTQGTSLTSANTVQVQVNVATVGAYTISTNSVNGVSFSKSGTFTATGVQSVTLVGAGTPVASGPQNYTVTFGTSTCNFQITFAATSSGGTGILTCKVDGVLNTFNDRADAELTDVVTGGPGLYVSGYAAPPNGGFVNKLQIFIRKNNGTPVTPGSYNENSYLSGFGIDPNGHHIEIDLHLENPDGSVTIWNTASNFGFPPPNPQFTIIITSATATRVKGTFSGKLTNTLQGSTIIKNITEGVFDVPVQ